MTSKARVLYQFDGQPGSGELTIFENEIITITRKDIGEGWWEGTNSKGESGLVPEAYLEEISHGHVSTPPNVPAPIYPSIPNSSSTYKQPLAPAQSTTSYNASVTSGASHAVAASAPGGGEPAGADWDDEWDDDSDNEQEQVKPRSEVASLNVSRAKNDMALSDYGGSQSFSTNQASVKGNLNRFSMFVKSGTEDYLLGKLKANVPTGSQVTIIDTEWGPMWGQKGTTYTCEIFSPKKESKLKGLKTFIAYQLTPSFTNVQISRRYKHFDWLHERLMEKFILIPIPPLPDKQVTGRYEEDFIEHRMAQLKLWVNHLCAHPVLSQCDVWQHFLTCTDEKRWKNGKRQAEKDELVGGGFFLSIKPPAKPFTGDIDAEINAFSTFAKAMDNGVRFLHGAGAENAKRHMGPFKREYEKLGQAFRTLGQAFELDPIKHSAGLTEAIKQTGDTYDQIGRLFEQQPRLDVDPMLDILHIYRGLLGSFPEILEVQKRTSQKIKDSEKLEGIGKLPTGEMNQLKQRADVISYSVMAEINHFHQSRNESFKNMMEHYLEQQIHFYSTIVDNLKASLVQYRNL